MDKFKEHNFHYAKSAWHKYISRKSIDLNMNLSEILEYIYTKK